MAYPGIKDDLRDYMSVNKPGAWFSTAYKKQQWDGKRYFITPTGKMATGFLPLLAKVLERDYPKLPVEVIDERGEIPTFKSELVTKIGSMLAEGDYEHQKHAIAAMDKWLAIRELQIPFPRGIINAATNAGKTAVIAGLFLNLEGDNRMLVLIHNKTIFTQLVEAFEDVFDGDVGIINASTYKPNIITVGMIKTLSNRIADSVNVKKDMAAFNVVAVDECHLAGGKTYQHVLKNVPAPVRMFVSGTPFDSDAIVNKMISIGLSGPEVFNISKRELMDKGISLEAKIHMHLCNEPVKWTGKGEEPYEFATYERIYRSAKRVAIMYDILKDYQGSTLIAVNYIEHGQLLSASLQSMGIKSIKFVHGDDPERDEKIQDFKDGKIKTLISTTILKEGVNIPIISKLIYAAGGKAKVDLKQWMGRLERLHKDMKDFIMHDFFDIGPYVERHSRSRRAAYKKEQLSVIEHYDPKLIRKFSA
jgi:superfamily II DNA or RNA helicase